MALSAASLVGWAGMAAAVLIAAIPAAASGFGFAVLATPFLLLFVGPASAVQIVIIITTAFSVAVLPGLQRAIDLRLLLRLVLGSLAGLPLGLAAFGYADPLAVSAAVGATIVGFAGFLALVRYGARGAVLAMSPARDLGIGAVSGVTTALLGMSGPPVLVYLLLAGAAPAMVRATLLAFFALSYAATLLAHVATIGVPRATWIAAAILVPFAFTGGLVGRRLGDRLGADAFAGLAIGLLAAAGLYTLAAAARLALQPAGLSL